MGGQSSIGHQLRLVAPLLALAVACLTIARVNSESPKVKLGVFMESRCPDTRRFFRNQLVPTHRLLGQIMDVNIVPFGHARTIGNNKMVCQHGERECEGNRRMACVIARTRNQTQVVETIGCLLKLDSVPKDCLATNVPSINFDELEKCTGGAESYQLMVEAEKASGRLGYVPHLTVDGKSSEEIQEEAEGSLMQYMCKLHTDAAQLEPCKSGADASKKQS